jgi:hypothetical protein
LLEEGGLSKLEARLASEQLVEQKTHGFKTDDEKRLSQGAEVKKLDQIAARRTCKSGSSRVRRCRRHRGAPGEAHRALEETRGGPSQG